MDSKKVTTKAFYGKIKEHSGLVRSLKLALIAVFGALAAATPVGSGYPIGISVIAALSGIYETSVGFAGAMLGTVLMDGTYALSYIPAYILLLLARFVISVFLLDARSRVKSCIRGRSGKIKLRNLLDIFGNGSTRIAGELFTEDMNIRCMLAAASSLTASLIYMLLTHTAAYSYLFGIAISAVIAPLFAYYLSYVGGGAVYPRDKLLRGGAALLFVAFFALQKAVIFGVKFSVIITLFAAMYASIKLGVGYGIAIGLIGGLCGDPAYVAVYPIAGAVCGLLAKKNTTAAVAAAGASAGIWSLYAVGLSSLQYFMPELIGCCAVTAVIVKFDILPCGRLTALAASEGADSSSGEHKILLEKTAKTESDMSRLSEATGACAEIFAKLSEGLSKPSMSELRRLCDESCDRFCSACNSRKLCWERDYQVAALMINKMTSELYCNHRAGADVIPALIAARCDKADELLDEINGRAGKLALDELSGDKLAVFAENYLMSAKIIDAIRQKRAEEFACDESLSDKVTRETRKNGFFAKNISICGNRVKHIFADGVDLSRIRLGSNDIREMFEALLGISLTEPEFDLAGSDVKMTLRSAACVSASSGETSFPIGNGTTCGDCATFFTNDDGYSYSLICDGMGSGSEAALVSNVASAYMERMLSAGCRLEETLEALNNFIRAVKLECSVTIDLMEIDNYSGRARFIKSGAAPSFIMRDGKIFKLQSKTVPIGIMRALDAEMIAFDMHVGDTVIMLSDGVAESFEDASWLLDMMCEDRIWKYPPETISRKICERAMVCSPKEDDISAIVVKIKDAV